jgi:hypothetical protein
MVIFGIGDFRNVMNRRHVVEEHIVVGHERVFDYWIRVVLLIIRWRLVIWIESHRYLCANGV